MAHIISDIVRTTSVTTGTGNFTVSASPVTGYIALMDAVGVGDTFDYNIVSEDGTEQEVGIGTVVGVNIFSRNVKASSNSGLLVDFSAGVKSVCLTIAAYKLNSFSGGNTAIIDILYADLVTAIAGATLTPFQKYRITNFHTTYTIPNTSEAFVGVNEPLIVTACATDELLTEAFSEMYPADKIQYDISNLVIFNIGEVASANTLYGVILSREDTLRDSKIYWDFRHSKWRRWWSAIRSAYTNIIDSELTSDYLDFYTFDDGTGTNTYSDASISSNKLGGMIKDSLGNIGICLANNVLFQAGHANNTVGSSFYNNTINYNFAENAISTGFKTNIISINFKNNTIGVEFRTNVIGDNASKNRISDYFEANSIEESFQGNIVGNGFYNNTIRGLVRNNIIGDDFVQSTLSYNTRNNKFANSVYQMVIGEDCVHNIFIDSIASSTIGDNFTRNIVYSEFRYNSIGNSFTDNTIGSTFQNNTIGDNFGYNNIDRSFTNNIVGVDPYGTPTGYNMRYVITSGAEMDSMAFAQIADFIGNRLEKIGGSWYDITVVGGVVTATPFP